VGKYEVDHFQSLSREPSSIDLNSPSGTSDSSETLVLEDIEEYSTLVQAETAIDDGRPDEYAPLKRLEGESEGPEETTSDVGPSQGECYESSSANSGHQRIAQANASVSGNLGRSLEDDNLAHRYRHSNLDVTAYEDKPKDEDERPASKIPKASNSTVAGAGKFQKPKSPDRQEVRVGRNRPLQSQAARSQEEHLFARLEDVLQKVEGRSESLKKELPVKFKDAVGRKFTFPFHLCNKWVVSFLRYIVQPSPY
jgi:hypothetical protein